MRARPTIGRRLILAGVAWSVVAALWLGASHPVTSFSLITLASGLVFAVLEHGRHAAHPYPWRVVIRMLLQGMSIAVVARLLRMDTWLAALLPALLQGALACLVARTLLPGNVPAIRRIAAALHSDGSPLPADVDRYTRRITFIWVITFCLLATLNAVAVLKPSLLPLAPLAWTLINALIVSAVIVLEFLYRRQRYATYTVHSFSEFAQGLRQIDPFSILLS